MTPQIYVSYTPTPDGGVDVGVDVDGQRVMDWPLAHEDALKMAASILRAAGTQEASFSNGTLHEATRWRS